MTLTYKRDLNIGSTRTIMPTIYVKVISFENYRSNISPHTAERLRYTAPKEFGNCLNGPLSPEHAAPKGKVGCRAVASK